MNRLRLFLTLCLLGCISISTRAYDFCFENSDGIPIYYNDVSINEFLPEVEVAYTSSRYTGELTIPEKVGNYTVIGIGERAFDHHDGLVTINLPKTLQYIGNYAFRDCFSLKNVNMNEQLTEIRYQSFCRCIGLESIRITASSVGNQAFYYCYNLENVTFSGNVVSVGSWAFQLATNIKNLIFEKGGGRISFGYGGDGDNFEKKAMFSGIDIDSIYLDRLYEGLVEPFPTSCTNRVLGPNITEVPANFYKNNASLKEFNLSSNVRIINEGAFAGTSIKRFLIPETLDSIGSDVFSGCYNLNIDVEAVRPPKASTDAFDNSTAVLFVPDGSGSIYRDSEPWSSLMIVDEADEYITINVKTPGTLYSRLLAQGYQPEDVHKLKLKGTLNDDDIAVLNAMTRLYSWDLSEFPMEELSADFFPNRLNLVSVKLPQTLKKINNGTFSGCCHLAKSIEIPGSCTMIGANAFNGCTRLSNVNLMEGQVIGNSAFANTDITSITIPKGVSLGASAFANTGMTEAVVEDGVLYIGGNAFGGDLEKLTFNGMVEGSIGTIGSGCLQEIQVPDIETWCKLSFVSAGPLRTSTRLLVGGSEISDVIIPSTIDKIRKYAFYNCSSLTSVVIPEGVDTIASEAFYGCTNLGSIVLPATLAVIEDGAFERCSLLDNVQLPQKLASIGTRTFKDCSTLKEITLPLSMSDIEESMFAGCTALATVTLPANLSKIGTSVFRNCASLEEVDLPISVTSIEGAAFKGCTSLKKIDLPLAITSLGDSVFQDCLTLDTVVVHWENPITANETMFANVSDECYLLVPLGAALTYYNAGWNVLIPNLQEAGVLNVIANSGGTIYYANASIRDDSERFYFSPYRSFGLELLPDEGYHVKRVKLNGTDVTSLLEDNLLYLEEPEENFTVRVVFADDNIVDGDSNGDMKVDEGDVINIVSYALKDRPKSFYDYASDMNGDEVINIVDAVIVIHNIKVQ